MKLYNSLTQQKECITPLTPGVLKVYLCGMTVYDYCHIGHARSWVVCDAMRRYWLSQGLSVEFVQNITDIDDKIIRRAQENQESPDTLTQRFIDAMHDDMDALSVMRPTHEPRATQYVDEMIALIQVLIDKDYAYQASNGDVCFDVRRFSAYGQLSKRDVEKLVAGARIDVDDGKRDPLDFVLWKQAKPGEPTWASPWGDGRPGWHIECSAMSSKLLGQPFDIHCGGMDLKFPHHENEIAQSEAAHDCQFAKCWLHVGLIQVNDEKMSKSLNNFLTIHSALSTHHSDVLRYFMLSGHYRSPLNYSEDNLQNCAQALNRLYTALRGVRVSSPSKAGDAFEARFFEALSDDFNSPVALSVLFELVREMNRCRQQGDASLVSTLGATLVRLGKILGLLTVDAQQFLQGDALDVETIESLIAQRQQARLEKDWAHADALRDQLDQQGVVIEDANGETVWRKKG